MAATSDLRVCMACAAQAPAMQKCPTCRTFEMDVYYCGRDCQVEKWQQHKDTHAIGASLLAIKNAPDNEERESKLRELLNIITEKEFWIDGIYKKDGKDREFINYEHIRLLCSVGEDPLHDAQVRRDAVDAMAALLPFSDVSAFNIGMHASLHKAASMFPSLGFVQWKHGKKGYVFDVDTMRCEGLADPRTDSKDLDFVYVWPFGETYSGKYMDEQWHGLCQFDYDDGGSYEGGWKAGRQHGQCNFINSGGGSYQGEVNDGEPHGNGYMIFYTGDTYEGGWMYGKPHGHGKYTFANGDTYKGQFQDGKPHGQGTLTEADGDRYEGQFQDGKRHGKGKISYANGNSYEGQIQDGKKHGQGKYTYANGDSYEGQYQDGKQHGHGKYIYAAGGSYEGQYQDGKRHGHGQVQ